MFALLSLALFLGADEAAPKIVESCPVALAQVITQALDDFEARYSELGLLGAAPLLGREAVADDEQFVATYAAFDGSAQAPAAVQYSVSRNDRRR